MCLYTKNQLINKQAKKKLLQSLINFKRNAWSNGQQGRLCERAHSFAYNCPILRWLLHVLIREIVWLKYRNVKKVLSYLTS